MAAQQIVAAASLIFNNILTQHEVSVNKKRRREAATYKHNICMCSGPPETMLEPVCVLEGFLHNENSEYIKKISYLYSWQFFLLADHLKDLIIRPREQPVTFKVGLVPKLLLVDHLKDLIIRPRDNNQSLKVGLVPKHDHYHRLFFALKWLIDGIFH